MTNQDLQNIARNTIEYIKTVIKPEMNLLEIRRLCEEKMFLLGADSFWYWDVGAFVFAGEETAISISGKDYKTSNRLINENDIITIDLSPQNNFVWGDFARTIIIENGKVVDFVSKIKNPEWKKGLLFEDKLHSELKKFAKPDITFEELYFYMNDFIQNNGFVNLDFAGNLGHSIVNKKDDRIYIENGNNAYLKEVKYWTFEPHIALKNSKFGYKKENIYYFENGELKCL